MTFITRFAPSPTGPLHLGHAYSALLAHDMARAQGGRFLLRIEDIDQGRSRPEWEDQLKDDLHWLGITWDEVPVCQSKQTEYYRVALQELWARGLLYPCRCTRADIRNAASAPQEGVPTHGPDGIIYPGTCRPLSPPEGEMPDGVLRLDMARALASVNAPLSFYETGASPEGQSGEIIMGNLYKTVGDVVLTRTGMPAAYHIAVVVDDAAQDITHVIRGQDLFEATHIHVLLQALLGLKTPTYHHHRLIRDDHGKRLAKRDDARAIRLFRDEGYSVQEIRHMVGL